MKPLLRASTYFRPDAPRVGAVFLLLLLAVALNLLKPWPLAFIIDSVLLEDKPFPGRLAGLLADWSKPIIIAALSTAILAIHFAHGALSAGHNYLSIKIGLRGLTRVRNELFAWLQRLSLRFHYGARAGDIIYRASWDTYAFQTLFQQGLVTASGAAISLGLMIAVMSQLNLPLTLLALAIVPLLVVVIKIFGPRMTERAGQAQQADSQITSMIQQTIAALPLIQSYTREPEEQRQFGGRVRQAEARRLAQHGSELQYGLSIALVFGLGIAAVSWLGANQVLAGRLSVGELIVFLAYLAQLYDPLNQLSHVGSTVAGASAGTRRVFEIFDTPEEVKDSPEARPILSAPDAAPPRNALVVRGGLVFEDVSFGYEPDRAVLHDIAFSLPPGGSLAIIGPSGSGKTTLLNLLPRFFDPWRGTIRLDGVDLRELRLRDLRAHVALVLQEPILLPATLAENIAYARPAAALGEIEAAARAANAHEFICRLPDGYDTVVGEGAARLSVGEKQRINLARAFLKNAPILLLDEPTSALDAANEALVTESLRHLMRGRTTLLVAHRSETIQMAQDILMLREGRVAEFGARHPEGLPDL